jgi:hypothetical protein
MDINVPGKDELAIIVIRENCKAHKRSWEGLAINVIRENCT